MDKQEGKYNIKAVSKILGIQPGTLRAWERRYQMIAPKRNDSGHRLYSEQHVKILKWLVSKVNQGFTISQAVSLLENNDVSTEEPQLPHQNESGDRSTIIADELLDALLQFDETKAHDLINQAFSLYTIDKVLVDILGTLLVKIGDLWEHNKITTAHEHFASSILRSRIGIILHSFPHNSILPKAVAVCGPGEWHELGLLIFTLFLRRKGFDVIYLGASIAEEDIDVVIDTVHPKFIFFSCTMRENVPTTLSLATKLKEEHEGLEIGLGGFAIDTLPDEVKKKYDPFVMGSVKNEWENWLKEKLS
jgi:DNA-binding transcriptional MerR regulator